MSLEGLDFSEFAEPAPVPAGEDAGFDGALAAGAPDDDMLSEFSLEDQYEAQNLKGMSFLSLAAALGQRQYGRDFSFVSKELSDWESHDFVEMGKIMAGIPTSKVRRGAVGAPSLKDIQEASRYSVSAIKYALREEEAPVQESHTSNTLPLVIFRIRGIRLVQAVVGPQRVIQVEVPGFSSVDGPKLRIGTSGVDFARVVEGATEFVNWFNVYHKGRIRYRNIDPLIRRMAPVFYQAKQVVGESKGNKIGIKDKVPIVSRIKGLTTVQGQETLLNGMGAKIVSAYGDASSRPSWPPTGKRAYDFIEWMLDVAYAPLLADAGSRDKVVKRMGQIVEASDKTLATLVKNIGKIWSAPLSESLAQLCSGGVTLMNTASPAQCYKHVHDSVEISRKQERAKDVTTRKRTVPYGWGAGLSASSSPATVANAIHAYKRLCGPWKGDVHGFGSEKESLWQRQVMKEFPEARFVWGSKDDGAFPEAGGDRKIVDPTLPAHVPGGSGRGRFLVSTVHPERGNGYLFGVMMTNYFGADYDGGAIHLYLGSDLEGETLIDGRSVPQFVEEWGRKYAMLYMVPGGSPHSQEYIMVFGGRRSEGWVWSPPQLAHGKGDPIKRLSAPADSELDLGPLKRYVALWYALKVIEMVRFNTWKAPYAMHGTIPHDPPGVIHQWHFMDDGCHVFPTGKGMEHATHVEKPDVPKVVDSTAFEGY